MGTGSGGPDHQPALARSNKPIRAGTSLQIEGADGVSATVIEVRGGGQILLRMAGVQDMGALLTQCGAVPLPPYIRGGVEDPSGADRERYQCVYADQPGAVAAPTAGLHLSAHLLNALQEAGVERCALTLHVGPGTFLPVRTDDLRQHQVAGERYVLSAQAAAQIQRARAAGRPVVAVGTTTTRVLETLAARHGQASWPAGQGVADLTILPGHDFRAIDGMISNFHLPRSSLLVLVSALVGRERILAAYAEAVRQRYRFYSYGDATLLL
jgi:S-adenosylmethionine:tRNA ribosyltransferase-isomerase